jgi:hypothetical protein
LSEFGIGRAPAQTGGSVTGLSASGAQEPAADTATVGFSGGKASFIYGYVGHWADTPDGLSALSDFRPGAMSAYDPETLKLLRAAEVNATRASC